MVSFPGFSALFFSAVLIVQVTASRAGRSTQGGPGKGILVQHCGPSGPGGYTNSRTSEEMSLFGSAGGEGKGEDCDGK